MVLASKVHRSFKTLKMENKSSVFARWRTFRQQKRKHRGRNMQWSEYCDSVILDQFKYLSIRIRTIWGHTEAHCNILKYGKEGYFTPTRDSFTPHMWLFKLHYFINALLLIIYPYPLVLVLILLLSIYKTINLLDISLILYLNLA